MATTTAAASSRLTLTTRPPEGQHDLPRESDDADNRMTSLHSSSDSHSHSHSHSHGNYNNSNNSSSSTSSRSASSTSSRSAAILLPIWTHSHHDDDVVGGGGDRRKSPELGWPAGTRTRGRPHGTPTTTTISTNPILNLSSSCVFKVIRLCLAGVVSLLSSVFHLPRWTQFVRGLFLFQLSSQAVVSVWRLVPWYMEDGSMVSLCLLQLLVIYLVMTMVCNWACVIRHSSVYPGQTDMTSNVFGAAENQSSFHQQHQEQHFALDSFPPHRRSGGGGGGSGESGAGDGDGGGSGSSGHVTVDVTEKGGLPWSHCERCRMYVPPRTVHCRFCRACVLRRDHHCHLVDSCIGHWNQRFFVTMAADGMVLGFLGTYLTLGFLWHHHDPRTGSLWDYVLPVTVVKFDRQWPHKTRGVAADEGGGDVIVLRQPPPGFRPLLLAEPPPALPPPPLPPDPPGAVLRQRQNTSGLSRQMCRVSSGACSDGDMTVIVLALLTTSMQQCRVSSGGCLYGDTIVIVLALLTTSMQQCRVSSGGCPYSDMTVIVLALLTPSMQQCRVSSGGCPYSDMTVIVMALLTPSMQQCRVSSGACPDGDMTVIVLALLTTSRRFRTYPGSSAGSPPVGYPFRDQAVRLLADNVKKLASGPTQYKCGVSSRACPYGDATVIVLCRQR